MSLRQKLEGSLIEEYHDEKELFDQEVVNLTLSDENDSDSDTSYMNRSVSRNGS